MIVKVQIDWTNESMLIYNKTRRICHEQRRESAPEDFDAIVNRYKLRPLGKVFVRASVNPATRKLELGSRTNIRRW